MVGKCKHMGYANTIGDVLSIAHLWQPSLSWSVNLPGTIHEVT